MAIAKRPLLMLIHRPGKKIAELDFQLPPIEDLQGSHSMPLPVEPKFRHFLTTCPSGGGKGVYGRNSQTLMMMQE
ncbi:MAG: hypothetical protein ACR2QH_14395 [Geminicoccaceae bacterium]